MPALDNPKYENFAIKLSMGAPKWKAWLEVNDSTMTRESAWASGGRMANDPDIVARVKELREEASEKCQMTKQELIDYLTDVIRLPASELTEDSPIVESIQATPHGRTLKTFSKAAAASLLAKLTGWEAPAKTEVTLSGSPEIDAALREILSA